MNKKKSIRIISILFFYSWNRFCYIFLGHRKKRIAFYCHVSYNSWGDFTEISK